MKNMAETTNTDDQPSEEVVEDERHVPSEGPTAEAKSNADKVEGFQKGGNRRPWPVDQGNYASFGAILRDFYASLSYSYMNRIFEKGMKQFKSGEHLDLEDLFEVPENMSSAFLVDRFW